MFNYMVCDIKHCMLHKKTKKRKKKVSIKMIPIEL